MINKIIVSNKDGPFQKLEKGEINEKKFFELFNEQVKQYDLKIDAKEFLENIGQVKIRNEMIDAVHQIKKRGIICGVITNNWHSFHSHKLAELEKLFDFFIEVFFIFKINFILIF